MPVLKILKFPNVILTTPATEVRLFDHSLKILIENMAETMYAAPGIGLAAPQIGEQKRIIVIDTSKKENDKIIKMSYLSIINPIITKGLGQTISKEGCLSLPSFSCEVERFNEIFVQGQDKNNNTIRFKVCDLLAIQIQHELDHINGILLINKVNDDIKEKYIINLKSTKK